MVTSVEAPCKIGNHVTVGHGAMLISCTIGDYCLIGQGAVIQAGSVVENLSMIAAGAIVLPETTIPNGQLWAGNPAKFVRALTDAQKKELERSALSYAALSKEHSKEFPQAI